MNRRNGESMIKGAIFDVDGTLLDSMEIWEDVGVRYLNSIGIEAEPDLGTVLFTMSIQEGAAYVKEHYHLSQEPEEIVQGVLDIISNYYKKTALLKSGAKELLEKLGYDLKFDEEQRKQSAHMEIAMVRKEYRGQGLQRKMMEESEQILKEQGYHYLLGTAHPDNVASVNTFLKLQYEQVMTKEKYGGMKRSIFCKEI